MNKTTYASNVKKLRIINNQLCTAGDILGVEFFEGPIGQLYDLVYDLMVPEGSPDQVYEQFGNIIFADDVDLKDIEEFYNSLFEE